MSSSDDQGSTAIKVRKVRTNTNAVCDVDGCNYETMNGHMKQHKRFVHGIDVTTYFCGVADCTYKSSNPALITRHKAYKHNDAPATIPCGVDGCTFMGNSKIIVSKHRSNCHNNTPRVRKTQTTRTTSTRKFHFCGQPGCVWREGDVYKTVNTTNMKYHLANTHNIDKKTRICGVGGCIYETTSTTNLKTHKRNIHDIDRVWYYCDDSSGCDYKCKTKSSLKSHKNIHHSLVPTPYIFCGEGGCEYKSKQKAHVKRHKANIHKSKPPEGRTDSAIYEESLVL